MNNLIYAIPAVGVLAILYMVVRARWVLSQPMGTDRMKVIGGYIARGAVSFLKAEYRVLAVYVTIAAVLIGILSTQNPVFAGNMSPVVMIVVSFILGAVLSALAGYIGMRIATASNTRTAHAAITSLSKALDVSFAGGSIMGMGVAGIGILGLGILFIAAMGMYNPEWINDETKLRLVLEVLTGFSLGAESIALFARVGGGIFTKAADVGADLVGKVEAGIPEDDPRNPAVIADNVGDNVGDVAGMGADLFGSYVSTMIATMVLGISVVVTEGSDSFKGISAVVLPLFIAALGVVFSIAGTFFVKVKEGGNPQNALNKGNWGAIILTAIASYFVINKILPATFSLKGLDYTANDVFFAVLIGLGVGALISMITEYYTALDKNPVNKIARQSISGPATNVLAGVGVGMVSTALPTLVLAAGIVMSYAVAGLYGTAMAAAGMMATTGIQLAIDAFGPIADNAGGVAEMSGLPKETRVNTDILDATGNTTAAVGKGFAIASAALTSLALFAAFMEITHITGVDVTKPWVLGGLFIGGMVPFLFSSMAISAVGRAANAMVQEVRRQFREIAGLLEGKEGVEPEFEKCIAISTNAAVREMILPGMLALATPVIMGFLFGPEVLGGMLAGVTVSGVLLAIFQSNAGGAWDNAKKSFEKGVEINGTIYKKGTEPHKAAVIGDTVGDPFKDTSGPSMNILIKLTCIVSLIIAPSLTALPGGVLHVMKPQTEITEGGGCCKESCKEAECMKACKDKKCKEGDTCTMKDGTKCIMKGGKCMMLDADTTTDKDRGQK